MLPYASILGVAAALGRNLTFTETLWFNYFAAKTWSVHSGLTFTQGDVHHDIFKWSSKSVRDIMYLCPQGGCREINGYPRDCS
ncbi:hypothetical protein JHK82_018068 [Glycine max]|nr:hypothetical protein JHK82_018068 [Glycine max]